MAKFSVTGNNTMLCDAYRLERSLTQEHIHERRYGQTTLCQGHGFSPGSQRLPRIPTRRNGQSEQRDVMERRSSVAFRYQFVVERHANETEIRQSSFNKRNNHVTVGTLANMTQKSQTLGTHEKQSVNGLLNWPTGEC